MLLLTLLQEETSAGQWHLTGHRSHHTEDDDSMIVNRVNVTSSIIIILLLPAWNFGISSHKSLSVFFFFQCHQLKILLLLVAAAVDILLPSDRFQ